MGSYPLDLGAEMMSTLVCSSPSLRTVRLCSGSSRANVPARVGMLLAVDHQRRAAAEDVEHLLLVAVGLVVLGNLLAGRDLDDIDPECPQLERAANELPVAGRLAIVPVGEPEAHDDAPYQSTTITQFVVGRQAAGVIYETYLVG